MLDGFKSKMNQRWTTGVKVYQCLAGLDGCKQLDTVGHLKQQSDNKNNVANVKRKGALTDLLLCSKNEVM